MSAQAPTTQAVTQVIAAAPATQGTTPELQKGERYVNVDRMYKDAELEAVPTSISHDICCQYSNQVAQRVGATG
ncbi:hypothetical protein C8F04DRAFT_1254235 [Mycena alexandri]|uniref:Uncharacterized protein n=1 Tax=Mycena alexandri TaxID=1745969 RepID=A0AAD6T624_9AGAR|nr:hypothetical protein C8F04DRAFT_1254235 [Mycena alexandri]